MIKEIYKGESVSFLLTFEETYDMARIQSHYIYVGNVPFIGEISGHTISLQLKSNETNELYGLMKVVLWLDDSLLGVRKPFLFDLNVVRTKAEPSNGSTSEINDVIVPIIISETEITVDDVLYNYVKGDNAFRVWQLQDGNADKTIDDYFDYLMQPALEAAEIADVATTNAQNASNLANEKAELANTKAGQAEIATTNANNAASLANEKAGLADSKATLAETATTNANNAEVLRATAEQGRVTAEGNRVTAESNRVTVEGNRVTTEQGRVTAENSRVSAESTRGSNETTRISNENTRISQEAARAAAEAARVASGAEMKTNMSTNIEADKSSTTKYPQLKALYDWATGRFLTMTQTVSQTIGATGARLAKLWATDIESTNMPTVGGVSLSTTFASKSTITDYIALYSRKIATVVNGVITAIQDTIDAHNSRVTADSGALRDSIFVKKYYDFCYDNNMFDSIKFAWVGAGGSKFRTSGIYSYFTKIYSMQGGNDAAQATAANQPFLRGNIAPTEKYGIEFPTGGSNYLSLTTTSTYAATDKWSFGIVANIFGVMADKFIVSGATSKIRIKFTTNYLTVTNASGTTVNGTKSIARYYGKNTLYRFQAKGDGTLDIYINGTLWETLTIATDFTFLDIFRQSTSYLSGVIYTIPFNAKNFSSTDLTAEYNFFRSSYPEIESVGIGTQTWATSNCEMVVTPQGTIIPEVQFAINTERVTDGDMEIITSWTTHNTGVPTRVNGTRTGGTGTYCLRTTVTGINQGVRQSSITLGRLYKVTGWVRSDGNQIPKVWVGGNSASHWTGTNSTSWQYFNFYQIANESVCYLTSGNSTSGYLEWDDVSYQEVGWSESQNLYDLVYANTTGTTEQKTYAAVKAAAMWKSPNNDVALAAVYGKRYNKFATWLMRMDIAYYNTANPSALWGWHVATRAELTTLSAIGGNAAKMTGTSYWTTANGTNTSGLTLLGAGYAAANGTHTDYLTSTLLMCSDADFARKVIDADNSFAEVAITTEGGIVRLIKD